MGLSVFVRQDEMTDSILRRRGSESIWWPDAADGCRSGGEARRDKTKEGKVGWIRGDRLRERTTLPTIGRSGFRSPRRSVNENGNLIKFRFLLLVSSKRLYSTSSIHPISDGSKIRREEPSTSRLWASPLFSLLFLPSAHLLLIQWMQGRDVPITFPQLG